MKKKALFMATICIAALILTSCSNKHYCHFKGTVESFYNWGTGYEPIKTVISVTIEGEDFYETTEETCENGVLRYDISGYDLKEGGYTITVEGYITIVYNDNSTQYVSDRQTKYVSVYEDGTIQNDFRLNLR